MFELTQYKQALEAAQKSEQALSQIVGGNSIATFVIDRDHRVTHWNRACEALTGHRAGDMIGTRRSYTAFYGEDRPVLADLVVDGALPEEMAGYYGNLQPSPLIAGAYQAEAFFPELDPDGKWLFFTAAPLTAADGQIAGAIETLQDFTDYRQTLARLHDSEQRYRLVTEQVADGVAIIQNTRFVFANAALVEILGYDSAADLMAMPVDKTIDPAQRQIYFNLEKDFSTGIRREKQIQIKCRRKDGQTCWIEAHNNFINWEGAPALLATISDITDRKNREMAIRQEAYSLKNENIRLKTKIKDRNGLGELIGHSPAMRKVYEQILKAAASSCNTVIYGESGTGKELVARTIHEMSDRSAREMITVNCGAIPESLFESEFFGHKKGAFTGAVMDKCGYLESAAGSTLFLDEVGEMPQNLQVKLLRAIENKGFVPLGSTRFKAIDVRLIAATNRDLKELVQNGQMREDFFYRIHVLPIQVPPLREHKEDLPLLVYHFLQSMDETGAVAPVVPPDLFRALTHYDWPGNVRELQNVLHRYHTFNTLDCLDCLDTPPQPSPGTAPACPPPAPGPDQNLRRSLAQYEKQLLQQALRRHQENRTQTAAALGIERRSLQRKLKKFGLNPARP